MKRFLIVTVLLMLIGCEPKMGDIVFLKGRWTDRVVGYSTINSTVQDAYSPRKSYMVGNGTRLQFVRDFPKEGKTLVIVLEGEEKDRHLYFDRQDIAR